MGKKRREVEKREGGEGKGKTRRSEEREGGVEEKREGRGAHWRSSRQVIRNRSLSRVRTESVR